MLWNFFSRAHLQDKAVAFRRVHEQWLTNVLASGDDLPHIPVRRVEDGGFNDLRARPGGRPRADQWWATAFARLQRHHAGQDRRTCQ